ncbi:hypothetical protein KIW84_073704 [Lathyrus oleraceus]|uniref:LOB domain-containing protein n=1 Tax=Pisum sativum TaxID=3888 RepID=A0A9D4ZZ01_PEA|nr:hypothetical protein KIW84_073704 [Pisum sativum]
MIFEFKSHDRMQESDNNSNNNVVTHQACSACKHQRKKCSDNCTLAPYFPSNKNKEFQAVHKVFGVSNITKMVKSCEETERKRVVDSLIWEALCRQKDPINGSLGAYKKVYNEYRKVFEELRIIKEQNQLLHMQSNQGLISTKPISDSNGMDYHLLHQNNGVGSSLYTSYYSHYLQDYDNLRTEVAIPIQQHSSQSLR